MAASAYLRLRTLAQAVGRLMRRSDDGGIVVIFNGTFTNNAKDVPNLAKMYGNHMRFCGEPPGDAAEVSALDIKW